MANRRFNRPGFEAVAAALLRAGDGAGVGAGAAAAGLTDLTAGTSALAAVVDVAAGISGSAGAFAMW